MDTLFIMDPLPAVAPGLDTTFDLMVAAAARGHRVFWCEPRLLSARGGVTARATQVELFRDRTPHFAAGEVHELALRDLGAVFMRKDPPVDAAYMEAALLLQVAEAEGARVYNRPASLLTANEKLYALNFTAWTPETLITAQFSEVRAFAAEVGRVVLKPLDGNGGRGVFVVGADDSNLMPLCETLTQNGARAMIAQRYLPAVSEGDKRIVLLAGEPLGAVNRVPPRGEHRANLHVGGTAAKTELSPRERELCAALKPRLVADGLVFVGIDVIGGYLTEVNVTSPTGVQEIRRLTGVDISPRVIDYIERQ